MWVPPSTLVASLMHADKMFMVCKHCSLKRRSDFEGPRRRLACSRTSSSARLTWITTFATSLSMTHPELVELGALITMTPASACSHGGGGRRRPHGISNRQRNSHGKNGKKGWPSMTGRALLPSKCNVGQQHNVNSHLSSYAPTLVRMPPTPTQSMMTPFEVHAHMSLQVSETKIKTLGSVAQVGHMVMRFAHSEMHLHIRFICIWSHQGRGLGRG